MTETNEFFEDWDNAQKEVKEYFEKNPVKKLKEGIGKNEKEGWIEEIDETTIYCRLRKDRQLDHELELPIGLLSEEQKQLVRLGQIIKFNLKEEKIKFLKEGETEMYWV